MTVYREHFTDENELAKGPEGWIYAGTDDEFGTLDRWMVPIAEELYRYDPKHPNAGIWRSDLEDMLLDLKEYAVLILEDGKPR